jgi:23S rRNA (adenine2503-C2)-methyltransferase
VETVLMRQSYGNSVCVSSQVGCGMGCTFCASTIHGLARNLTCGEILAQVQYINALLNKESAAVDSVVIMGSGEPLANYENVLKFIRLCHEKYCLGMSYRSFTLSTAGIVPGIDRLAAEGLPVTLAVSLHAPDNSLRSKLMPINWQYPLEEVLAAGDRYAAKTGRRVTYEYTLIAGVNDSDSQARALAALLRNRLANVNLIPVNAVPERGLLRPDDAGVDRFWAILKASRVNATLRREMGGDIKAACGQLRHAVLTGEKQDR